VLVYRHVLSFSLSICRSPSSTLFPYTTLFRSVHLSVDLEDELDRKLGGDPEHRFALRRVYSTAHVSAASLLVHLRRRDVVCVQRSEEHTSELQSRRDLVCRLLLEKKKEKSHVQ